VSASVAAFLAQVRERGAELPPALSGALLLAAVRLSESRSQALRPSLLMVDDEGELSLVDGEAGDDGYAAPELAKGHAPPRDPRVLVYAAGALGCELCTLRPPNGAREFAGPLAPVLRRALAPERKKRYRNLAEMAAAIEEIQSRPTHEEEKLILAAVAAQSSNAASARLAKIELKKHAPQAPNVVFAEDVLKKEQHDTPKEIHPAFAQKWDPLEAPPEVFFEKPLPFESGEMPAVPDAGVVEMKEHEVAEARAPSESAPVPPLPPVDSGEFPALLARERKARQEDLAVLEMRVENLARLGARLSALEQQVRSSAPPPPSLAQRAKLLIDERRFAEAEQMLTGAPETDAVLQLRLGQALCGQTDADGTRTARAEAAFRQAAGLDAAWALPRALLGALLLRQGMAEQAQAALREALAIDPACVEARAAMPAGAPRRLPLLTAAAGGLGVGVGVAAAVALVVVARSPEPPAKATQQAAVVQIATPVPPPVEQRKPESPPAPPPLPAPVSGETKPAAAPEPAKAAPDKPRARKFAPAGHSAAQAEAARGDKALRSFDTKAAQASFEAALKLDPALPSAHRGMGMVYVLLGKNAEAKTEYRRYLELDPNAADKDQIERLLSR